MHFSFIPFSPAGFIFPSSELTLIIAMLVIRLQLFAILLQLRSLDIHYYTLTMTISFVLLYYI